MRKWLLISILISILIISACSQESGASNSKESDFPQKSIEVVIPYSAGGLTDTMVRAIARVADKYVPNDQSLVIVNTPGVQGTVSIQNSKPDGHTIGAATTGTIGIQPFINETAYTSESFIPIAGFLDAQAAFVVASNSPFDTFDEWLDYVEENPREFKFAASGAGNSTHLSAEALNHYLEIETEVVPFEGGSNAITALLGGHVDGYAMPIQEVISYLDSGEIKVLADMSKEGIDFIDDVIRTQEEYNFNSDIIYGLVAPNDVPQEELDIIVNIFEQAINDPETIELFKELGYETNYSNPEQFYETLNEQTQFFEGVYQQTN